MGASAVIAPACAAFSLLLSLLALSIAGGLSNSDPARLQAEVGTQLGQAVTELLWASVGVLSGAAGAVFPGAHCGRGRGNFAAERHAVFARNFA
jgi:hypothetical protein